MKTKTHVLLAVALTMSTVLVQTAPAQESTAPFTDAEREEIYSKSIGKRATDIISALEVGDTNKSTRVYDAIMAQYRSLRARDEAVDVMFRSLSKNAPGVESNRAAVVKLLSKQLHEQFLAKLSADLTADQAEKVKDRMTYNKVKVTYDAYCEIVPGLKDSEKAAILDALKVAREEAMDGGSADEKSAIFQRHKEKINATLSAKGHDVDKATKAWEARQIEAQAKKESAAGK
jgi:hypothetical protein